MIVDEALLYNIGKKLNASKKEVTISAVSGGSINYTAKIIVKNDKHFFVKINDASTFPGMFLKEKRGLQLLKQQNIILTPNVIDDFILNNKQVLILEWINGGNKTSEFWKTFGKQMAALHSTTNKTFGLEDDNYMGSVIQKNTSSNNWIEFFITQRLQPVIKMCTSKGLLSSKYVLKFQNLYKHLPHIYNIEKPSLLHGDLWSGNYMCNQDHQPVLIDPAVYYGHRSIDLGMTTLFGEFDKAFYEAYNYYYALPTNYKDQWQVSNLYPLLIHLLLFGSSYLHPIDSVLNTYQ